jgi:Ni,Fe-hydrogenase maturation factor
VEPDMDGQMGLSAPVQNAVDSAVRTIEEIIGTSSKTEAA